MKYLDQTNLLQVRTNLRHELSLVIKGEMAGELFIDEIIATLEVYRRRNLHFPCPTGVCEFPSASFLFSAWSIPPNSGMRAICDHKGPSSAP